MGWGELGGGEKKMLGMGKGNKEKEMVGGEKRKGGLGKKRRKMVGGKKWAKKEAPKNNINFK